VAKALSVVMVTVHRHISPTSTSRQSAVPDDGDGR
jgi:hypothetical protein